MRALTATTCLPYPATRSKKAPTVPVVKRSPRKGSACLARPAIVKWYVTTVGTSSRRKERGHPERPLHRTRSKGRALCWPPHRGLPEDGEGPPVDRGGRGDSVEREDGRAHVVNRRTVQFLGFYILPEEALDSVLAMVHDPLPSLLRTPRDPGVIEASRNFDSRIRLNPELRGVLEQRTRVQFVSPPDTGDGGEAS